MNEWPKETMPGSAGIMRDVVLYLEGNGKLWIHKDDVEWLVRSLWTHQQLKGVAAVASDDEGPDAPKSMEPDLTPEKCPQSQEAAGNLYDKWGEAP